MKPSIPDSKKHTLKLRIFNPSRLSDEELEKSFTVHLELFKKLFDRIINEKKGHVPQHHLIVGQRGMGKTTLLCRIAVELRKPEYRKQYIPLQFPEEQYIEIDRLSKLWLNCLDALADALEEEGDSVAAKDLDAKIHSLNYSDMNEREVARKAQKLFEKTAQTIKQRPVLLFDNFHLILDRLREEDYTLRAFFMREDAPILIGASTVMPGDTNDYGAAFYDAFMIHLLHRLSLQEMQSVLRRLAENSGNFELLTKIQSETPRLATLRDLTGGNPRTTILLFELFSRGFSKDAYEDLESLLDHMTPLYQSRFDQLSEQSQLVLSALARNWSPASAQQLTKLTSLPRGSISTQLNRLEAIGMVEKVELSKGKKPGYQVAERFFNIWYLMRFAARRERSGLVFLTRFLQEFYIPAELNQRAFELIRKGQLSEGERAYAMALAETGLNASIVKKLRSCVDKLEFSDFHDGAEKVNFTVNEPVSSGNNSWGGLITKEKVDVSFHKIIEANPDDASTWNDWGIKLYALGSQKEAVEKFKKSVEIDPAYVHAWFNWGICLYTLGRYNEALNKFEKTVEIAPNYVDAWNNWGTCLNFLGRYEEAIGKYRRAVTINPNDANILYNWGNSLRVLGLYDEAIEKYEEALEINPDHAKAWNYLGICLLDYKGKLKRASEAFSKLLKLLPGNWVPLVNLAFLYRDFMDDPQKARAFVQKLADTEKFAADSMELQKMLFASREQNWGQVKQHLAKALELIVGAFPSETCDDWYRASAALLHQGYGVKLIKFLDEEGLNIRLMPWVEAIRAHSLQDRRHLLDIPQESREVAGKIYDEIAVRRQWLPESTRNLFIR